MAAESRTDDESESSGVPGWVWVLAAVVVLGGLGGAYWTGRLSDQHIAALMAGVFGLLVAGIALKAGMESAKPVVRLATLATVVLMLGVSLYPAKVELMPGEPDAQATLSLMGQSLALPSPGTYRLLVGARLPRRSDPRIGYQLEVEGLFLDGTIEKRVAPGSRGGATMSLPAAQENRAHEIVVREASPKVVLAFTNGDGGVPLIVSAVKVVPSTILHALMVLLLAISAVLEARVASARGAISMGATASVLFGLVLRTGDPGASMGMVLGSALLAAGGGAVLGTIIGKLGRWLLGPKPVPAAENGVGPETPKKGGASKPGGRGSRAA